MLEGLKRLLTLAGQQRNKLIASCVLSVIGTALGLVPFILIYLVIVELFEPVANVAYIWKLVLLSILAVILRFVAMALSGSISHIAAYNILYDLRIKLAEKLGTLSLGYFNDRNTGEVKTTMNEQVERIELFIAHGLPDVTSAIVVPIMTAILLALIDWRMTLATLAVIPVALIAQGMMFKDHESLMAGYRKALEKLNSTVIEYTQGIAVIKAFNQTVDSFNKYRDSMDEYCDYVTNWSMRFAPGWTTFSVALGANILIIIPVGAWLYDAGSITMPVFTLFFLLGLGFCDPLMKLMLYGEMFAEVLEAERRIDGILSEKPLLEPDMDNVPSNLDIMFNDVCFSYNETSVLHNLTFSIPEKTVTALVGPSGAGKTTVARLIPRFWDADSGEITIGGIDIRDMKTMTLMNLVSSVFQEVFLFNDTIYENIRMGTEDTTKEDVIAASKMAHCHEFISVLPAGYQTIVGERGAKLSGGEKQRISIARAIVKDAPVIIMDEATAFVDPENEDLIQDAIATLTTGKTLIIIAHRLRTITGSNTIIVLDEGRIVETGSHQELLDTGSLYSRMWDAHTSAQDWKFETEGV